MRAMSMEERMTVCNMSIEGGARAGMVAPDDTTFHYLAGREFAPQGGAWDNAVAFWKTLPTDEGATFDDAVTLDANNAHTDDHLRHEPRDGDADHRPRPRTTVTSEMPRNGQRWKRRLRIWTYSRDSRCSAAP